MENDDFPFPVRGGDPLGEILGIVKELEELAEKADVLERQLHEAYGVDAEALSVTTFTIGLGSDNIRHSIRSFKRAGERLIDELKEEERRRGL